MFEWLVDNPLFLGDAAGPVTAQAMFQGLWFADTFMGRTLNILNQQILLKRLGFFSEDKGNYHFGKLKPDG